MKKRCTFQVVDHLNRPLLTVGCAVCSEVVGSLEDFLFPWCSEEGEEYKKTGSKASLHKLA